MDLGGSVHHVPFRRRDAELMAFFFHITLHLHLRLSLIFIIYAALHRHQKLRKLDWKRVRTNLWNLTGVMWRKEVAGTERIAGVLAQCPALAHLNLSYNDQQLWIELLAIDLACLVRDQMLWMTANSSNEFHVD
jgi:hypothetical protein